MKVNEATWQRLGSSIKRVLQSFLRRFEVAAGLGLTLPSLIADTCFEASQAESFIMLSKRSRDLLPEIEYTLKQKDRVQSPHNDRATKLESELTDFFKRRFADNASQGGSMFLRTSPSEPYIAFLV